MNLATIAGIVLSSCGALILGMAALIKTMIMDKWRRDAEEAKRDRDEMSRSLNKLLDGQQDLKDELHDVDLRVTRLEAEHRVHYCYYNSREVTNGGIE